MQVDKQANGQASGPIPIKALSDATSPFGMTSTNACFVIDLKFEKRLTFLCVESEQLIDLVLLNPIQSLTGWLHVGDQMDDGQ